MTATETSRFWTAAEVSGLDLLTATFTDQVFPRHTHDHFVIGINLAGVQGFERARANHRAPTGTIVVINPDDVHTGFAATREPWVYRGFYPSVDLLSELTGMRETVGFRDAVIQDASSFALLLGAHAACERSSDALVRSSLMTAALREFCLRHATPRISNPGVRSATRLERVRAMLLDRFDENLTLNDLAAVAGLSPFHLLRSFQQRYGLPPHLFRIQHRVNVAKRLIAAGVSIADAAAESGFTDQSHLTRWFRRFVGATPAAYRRGVASA